MAEWWLNHPSEKYARQIGSFPQVGMEIKKYLKSPPRWELNDPFFRTYATDHGHPQKCLGAKNLAHQKVSKKCHDDSTTGMSMVLSK